jgi:hypothetical protein
MSLVYRDLPEHLVDACSSIEKSSHEGTDYVMTWLAVMDSLQEAYGTDSKRHLREMYGIDYTR